MSIDLEKISRLKAEFVADLKADRVSARQLLKDRRLKNLFQSLKSEPPEQRQKLGKALNQIKSFLEANISKTTDLNQTQPKAYLDVTAPWDLNQTQPPAFFDIENGSIHPVSKTQAELLQIFAEMGFRAIEPRQIDNQFYMFDSLNFPKEHPARDQFDTFLLKQLDLQKRPLVAPAHTSSMQNRILRTHKDQLENNQAIAVIIPGRVFRNEDVDMTHDHMFYQLEGIYVSQAVSVANLIAVLREAIASYLKRDLDYKIQPFYFPFTEPSFEFAASCPFCLKKGCKICKAGWIELLGCGLIHPNVLKAAGIDSQKYSGFAWGIGLTRLVMLKSDIEDIRHLASGYLKFLRQFKYES